MYKTIGLKHETPVHIGAQRCKDNKLKGIPGKMFDWDKAVDIINNENISNAAIGLAEDWFHTSTKILEDGKPIQEEHMRVFAFSDWATPCLYDYSSDIAYECWKERDDSDFQTLIHDVWTEDLIRRLKK